MRALSVSQVMVPQKENVLVEDKMNSPKEGILRVIDFHPNGNIL